MQAVKERLSLKKDITIGDHECGLLCRDGRFVSVLDPGRYEFWRWEKVAIRKISMRQMSEVITGQEILTSDKVEVRISLVAHYSVTDPRLALDSVESFTDQLHQEVQLSLREAVAGRTIEALLEAREEIGKELLDKVAPGALVYGITLKRVGVRDIILPGVVRNVFLKEVEADRSGRADLIKARHEVATARARANTA